MYLSSFNTISIFKGICSKRWICCLDSSQVPCKGKGLSWNLSAPHDNDPWGNSASSVQSRHSFTYKTHIWDSKYLVMRVFSSWYQVYVRYTHDNIHEICFAYLWTTDDLVDELKHMNFRESDGTSEPSMKHAARNESYKVTMAKMLLKDLGHEFTKMQQNYVLILPDSKLREWRSTLHDPETWCFFLWILFLLSIFHISSSYQFMTYSPGGTV